MSAHSSQGFAFDWGGDPGPGVEADRRALADQFRLCHAAGRTGRLVTSIVDGLLAFVIPHVVSLTLGAGLIALGAALIG